MTVGALLQGWQSVGHLHTASANRQLGGLERKTVKNRSGERFDFDTEGELLEGE